MKRLTIGAIAMVIMALFILAMFPEDMMGEEKGSDKKGKYYYKKSCKTCHSKDGEGGELTPISKTQAQWEEFFEKGMHGDQKLSDAVEEDQIIHIKTFLINHAADSDQPETCG